MDLEDTISPMTTAARSTALTAATRYQVNAKTSLGAFGSKTGLRDGSSSKASIFAPDLRRRRRQRKLLGKVDAELYFVVLFAASLTCEQVFTHTLRLISRKLAVAIRRQLLITCFLTSFIPLIRTRYADDPACEPTSCVPD